MTRGFAAVSLALVLTVALTACGAGTSTEILGRSKSASYVALGDSYTSAPGVGDTVDINGCYQATGNYPRIVAKSLGLNLDDRSCAGANSGSVVGRQMTILQKWVGPQIKGVTAHAKLVTFSLGANDFALYNFIYDICPKAAAAKTSNSPCTDADRAAAPGMDLAAKLQIVKSQVLSALRAVRRKAPAARVLVVGYPDLIPTSPCAAFPLAAGDVPFASRIISGLNSDLKAAATQTRSTYVDVFAVTHGHDICSADPWIAGEVDRAKGVPWHPYAAEQHAAADAIVKAYGATGA